MTDALQAGLDRISRRIAARGKAESETRALVRSQVELVEPKLVPVMDGLRTRFAARLTYLDTAGLTLGNPAQMTPGVVPVEYRRPGDRSMAAELKGTRA